MLNPKAGITISTIAILLAGSIIGLGISRDETAVREFEFELGKTIEETAAQTQLQLKGQNNFGLIDAGMVGIPDQVYGKYVVPNYEVRVGPLAAIVFYSDTERYPAKNTHIVNLAVRTRSFSSYAELYEAFYELVIQLQGGRWQRYVPDECPRLSGRKSILDDEEISKLTMPDLRSFVGFDCPADPLYRPTLDEWRLFASNALKYQWHDGSGKIATLTTSIGNAERSFDSGRVHLELEFELEDSIRERIARNREAELKEPWGEMLPKVEAEKKRIRQILENINGSNSGIQNTDQPLPRRMRHVP